MQFCLFSQPSKENEVIAIRIIVLWVKSPVYAYQYFAIWPRGYKTFFVLNSAEHEISTGD